MSTPMMPDTRAARELLRAIGMDVPAKRIHPVPGGTINTTFRIEQGDDPALFLRIAPSDSEVEAGPGWMTSHGLRREAVVVEMLAGISHLLPRMVHTDWSRSLIDRDWVVQTGVPGRAWSEARRDMSADQELGLWRKLGGVVNNIHAVTGSEFGPPEEGFGHHAWSDMVRWDVTGLAVDARRFDIDETPFNRLTEAVNRAAPVLNRITEPRLVHSDLHQGHVFVRRTREGDLEISGIIDLEFARFADAMSETVFIHQGRNAGMAAEFAAFCEGYGCDAPSHDDDLRAAIYRLTSYGWEVMDLVRRGRHDRAPQVLDAMGSLLDDLEKDL